MLIIWPYNLTHTSPAGLISFARSRLFLQCSDNSSELERLWNFTRVTEPLRGRELDTRPLSGIWTIGVDKDARAIRWPVCGECLRMSPEEAEEGTTGVVSLRLGRL